MQVGPDSLTINAHFTFDLLSRWIMGALLIGAAAFLRGQGLDGWQDWMKIFQPLGPTLNVGEAPAGTVTNGIRGLLTWLIGIFSWPLLTLLGIDQIFLGGIVWEFILNNINMLIGF